MVVVGTSLAVLSSALGALPAAAAGAGPGASPSLSAHRREAVAYVAAPAGRPRRYGRRGGARESTQGDQLVPAAADCAGPAPSGGQQPLMLVVGASFTAGVGASSPVSGWAYRLASDLGWRLVDDGVPGAGYVHVAKDGGGPIGRLLRSSDLPALRPAMVIIQAGHDDIGEPLGLVSQRVTEDVDMVTDQDPKARLVLVTVFTHDHRPTRQAVRTDNAIVSAARKADPGAIIIDPLRAHWRFPRIRGGLHPTQYGHDWIATRVASTLLAKGVRDYSPDCLAMALGRPSVPGAYLRS